MGIINMSPESFSGDGFDDVNKAITHAKNLVNDGADILDIGGKSTRPHTSTFIENQIQDSKSKNDLRKVDRDEELRRVIPLIAKLKSEVSVPISIDTYDAKVAQQALIAGATVINDIWGLKADPKLARVAAEFDAQLVIMHNQEDTLYTNLVSEIKASLINSVEIARKAGVAKENIILDPGFGFGKLPNQNLQVLRRLNELKALGFPILIGTSNKSTIGSVLDLRIDKRTEGTSATVAISIANGADIVRAHDVKTMSLVSKMTDAVIRHEPSEGDG
ncbi:MAG: dihydropteroate synthase [Chloroflexi bacterium]|jgi:dihydropteroate synthase|nr:MAG: dihydropteroate synthase [Chloroflexota bacterium]